MIRSVALTRAMPRLRVAAASVAAFFLLTAGACGGDELTGPATASGSYQLTGIAVGGVCCSGLPVTIASGTQVTTGTLTFASGGTFNMQVAGTQGGNATTFRSDAGTYVQSGGTITFTPGGSSAAAFTGTISDNDQIRIPMTVQGYNTTLRFAK